MQYIPVLRTFCTYTEFIYTHLMLYLFNALHLTSATWDTILPDCGRSGSVVSLHRHTDCKLVTIFIIL